ncbi:hypothetical protein [Streptomyces griseus]|uniref:hypothetical protein n=1 Tax=Streptomyces griseus TaxID=1911 RepID=UPI0011814B15|nr:hypothetical protein [Streptomyces fimicarius]
MASPSANAAQQGAAAAEMASDSDLALTLISAGAVTGTTATEVRDRCRAHIRALIEPAQLYVNALADGRAKDIAQATVEHAKKVAEDTGGDPEATLRLLAKSVSILLRYAAHQRKPT